MELICSLRHLGYARFVETVHTRHPLVVSAQAALSNFSAFVKKVDSKSDSISARHAEYADKTEV